MQLTHGIERYLNLQFRTVLNEVSSYVVTSSRVCYDYKKLSMHPKVDIIRL